MQFVEQPGDAAAAALRARLAECRAKYTVYDDIVVLDAAGQMLVRLADSPARWAELPSWWGSLLARDCYVERYEASSLFDGAGASLVYAHRIVGAAGQAKGAVLLRFDFASAVRSIFEDPVDPQHHSCVVFIDQAGEVIASARPTEFVPGSRLDPVDDRRPRCSARRSARCARC